MNYEYKLKTKYIDNIILIKQLLKLTGLQIHLKGNFNGIIDNSSVIIQPQRIICITTQPAVKYINPWYDQDVDVNKPYGIIGYNIVVSDFDNKAEIFNGIDVMCVKFLNDTMLDMLLSKDVEEISIFEVHNSKSSLDNNLLDTYFITTTRQFTLSELKDMHQGLCPPILYLLH